MSPTHREPDGTRKFGPSWESLIERKIREAMESGAFDDLPHQGASLPLEDDSESGDWALAHRMLRNAGAAPPWIQADKEARLLLDARERLFDRARSSSGRSHGRLLAELERLVTDINRAIERVNAEAPTDRQHRRPLEFVEERTRLEDALGSP